VSSRAVPQDLSSRHDEGERRRRLARRAGQGDGAGDCELVEITRSPRTSNAAARSARCSRSSTTIEGLESRRVPSHAVRRSPRRDLAMDGEGRAAVALVGHLDTVFLRLFEGLHARRRSRAQAGVLDMKGALVSSRGRQGACRSRHPRGAPRPPPGRRGRTRRLARRRPEVIARCRDPRCRRSAVFEAGRKNDLVITPAKGTGAVTATAHGKAAHAGNAHKKGANALWAIAKLVDRAQASPTMRGRHRQRRKVTGGSAKNTVPDRGRGPHRPALRDRAPTAKRS